MIKKILSVLALSSVAVMGLSSVSASAAMTNSPVIQSNLKIVNSKTGLAIRDSNCKKIASVKNKENLYAIPKSELANQDIYMSATKTCKINGTNVKMVLAMDFSMPSKMGYVSSKFLTQTYTTAAVQKAEAAVYDNPAVQKAQKTVGIEEKFIAKTNLNVRDGSCKVKDIVKAGSDLQDYADKNGTGGAMPLTCKFGNKHYQMIQVGTGFVSPTGVYVK